MEKFQITIRCGCVKKGYCWKVDNARYNVVIFEGMEEHVSRYDEMARYLNKNGINVYGIDTFGQGENVNEDLSNIGVWPTDGFLKQVDHYDQLIAQLEGTKLPTYVFAHSMGSYMGQAFIEQYPDRVKKIVLCGSGAKNGAVGVGYALAKLICTKKKENKKAKLLNNLMFGGFNKRIQNPETPFDWLSVNKKNVTDYIADPLCGFGPRNKFCLEFLKGMKTLYTKENLNKINKNISIFLITGEEDPVSTYSKATYMLEKQYKGLGINDVSFKVYKGLRHEIHNEDDRELVFKDIVDFFNK